MLQIYGTAKCKETQKAIRYCKERRIEHQFIDLNKYELKAKEWDSIFNNNNPEDCINKNSDYYKKNGYAWREYDPVEELKEHQELLVTPILRVKTKAILGLNEKFLMDER